MLDKPEMVTSTIRITKEQYDWLRDEAFKARISQALLIRDLIDAKIYGGDNNAD